MKTQILVSILSLVLASYACTLKNASQPTPPAPGDTPQAVATLTATDEPTPPPPATDTPPALCTVTTGISGGALNIRQSGLMSSPITGTAAEGDTLTVLSTAGGWLKVQTQAGRMGYVKQELCK